MSARACRYRGGSSLSSWLPLVSRRCQLRWARSSRPLLVGSDWRWSWRTMLGILFYTELCTCRQQREKHTPLEDKPLDEGVHRLHVLVQEQCGAERCSKGQHAVREELQHDQTWELFLTLYTACIRKRTNTHENRNESRHENEPVIMRSQPGSCSVSLCTSLRL
jgi:hypothetical protein